jgi:hypothetical protein
MKKLIALAVAALFCVALLSPALSAAAAPWADESHFYHAQNVLAGARPTGEDPWGRLDHARNVAAGDRQPTTSDCGCAKTPSATSLPGVNDYVSDENPNLPVKALCCPCGICPKPNCCELWWLPSWYRDLIIF